MVRDGPCGFYEKKVLKPFAMIVGYLQFVERKQPHAALHSTGQGASTVARKLRRWLSMSSVKVPLKNCCVKPSR